MIFPIAFLMKTFSTIFADLKGKRFPIFQKRWNTTFYPWFKILMNTHVCIQCWWTIKCFSTNTTCMRLFRCMNDLMTTECRCLSKTFSTYLTIIYINPIKRKKSFTLQTNGRIPVWTGICRTRLYCAVKIYSKGEWGFVFDWWWK
jgi:hypothetical protein